MVIFYNFFATILTYYYTELKKNVDLPQILQKA